MNEFGIDSLQLAGDRPMTQAMVNAIAYAIQKNGVSSKGPEAIGSSSYYNQTFTTYNYFEQNVQIMHQNNKPIGAYFFSYAWDYNSAYYEATLECDALRVLTYQPDWPVFIDWETASRNAVAAHGYAITSQRLQDIVHGWAQGCRDKGYVPGFYMGAAIARDDLGSSAVQSLRAEGIYFWEAHYRVTTPYVVPYDIWQYNDNQTWIDGTIVDYNTIGDDRMWNIGPVPPTPPTPPVPASTIPIWLQLYMKQRGDNSNGKHTILL